MKENNNENLQPEVNQEELNQASAPAQPTQPEVEATPENVPPQNPVEESKTETMEPIVDTPKKGKGLLIGIIIGVIVLAGLGFLLTKVLLNSNTIIDQGLKSAFTEARKSLDEINSKNLTYNFEKDSVGIDGTITFTSDYKDSEVDLTKLKDYKLSYSVVADKKNNKASAGFKIDKDKSIFDVNAMMNGKNVFVTLGDIYDKTLTFETEKELKDLEMSSITTDDIKLLVSKTETVIREQTKQEKVTEKTVTKEIDGKKGKYKQLSYKIDANTYMKKLIEAYQSDDEVVDVLARMSNSTEKEIRETLKEQLDSLKEAEKEEITINVYTSGLIPQTKEVEIVEDTDSIVIDIDNNLYKYKLLEDKEVLASGTYDKDKREFKLNMKQDDLTIDATVTAKSDNKLVGKINMKEEDTELVLDFEETTKVKGKTASSTFKATVDFKSGEEKFNFGVTADTNVTIGSKVKEIKEEGAVKSDEISEAEMNALYTKLLEKVGTIMNDIAPNYASSDNSLMNSLV